MFLECLELFSLLFSQHVFDVGIEVEFASCGCLHEMPDEGVHELTFVEWQSLFEVIKFVNDGEQDFLAQLFELVLECLVECKVSDKLCNLTTDLSG